MNQTVKNLLFFKIGWLACVAFAAAGKPAMASLAVAAVALAHIVSVAAPRKEILLLAVAAVIGLAWESLLVKLGLVEYVGHASSWLAPYWIVAMWVLFATTVNHGLRWAKRAPWIAAVAGLAGGPMAFYGGMKMGAVVFPDATLSLTVIALGWGVLLPLLTWIADSIIDMEWLEPVRRRPDAEIESRQPLVV